jgi:hypothetical protein
MMNMNHAEQVMADKFRTKDLHVSRQHEPSLYRARLIQASPAHSFSCPAETTACEMGSHRSQPEAWP